MPSESNAPAGQTKTSAKTRSKTRRLVILLGLSALLSALVMGGVVWRQELTVTQASDALERGETKYALYQITQFLERHPTHTRALAVQARGLLAIGSINEAYAIFDQIGAASAEDLDAFAEAAMHREEWSLARGLLLRLLQLKPDDPDTLYEVASCEDRLGLHTEALEHAERLTKYSEHAARANVLVGSIHGFLRNNAQAADAFEKVFQQEPDGENLQISPADAFLRYGRILMSLGRPREALEPLKQSVARQETGEGLQLLGDAASQLGQPDRAKVAWKRAVEIAPDQVSARIGLANAALLEGQAQEALQWIQPLENSESMLSSVSYLFQRAYAMAGDEEQASRWQEKTAELRTEQQRLVAVDNLMANDPQSFWARAARAHRFASERNWDQAELIVNQLTNEAPGEPFIIELADAVRRRQVELPSLTRIPVLQK